MKLHARTQSGITLIELMVVVVIVGILASIAYPSYQEYVRRGQRAAARAQLMEAAQFMERMFTMTNNYTLAAGGAAIALPPDLTRAPKPPSAATYNIALAPTATTFTLIAAPVAGGSMAGDRCGSLTLDQSGTQGRTGAAPVAECWGH
jgi:type IV pilus assembly protein PilE